MSIAIRTLACAVALLAFALPASAGAVPGTLDTSFDTDGQLPLAVGPGVANEHGNAVAVSVGGKVVTGGRTDSSTFIVRRNANGTPDTTWNGTGARIDNFSAAYDTANAVGENGFEEIVAVAILPNDGVIAAGYGHLRLGNNLDWFVARYTPAGALDPSFGGGDGVVELAVTAGDRRDVLGDMAVDGGGNVLLAGSTQIDDVAEHSDIAVAKLNTNGEAEFLFGGGDGIDLTAVAPANGGDSAYGLTLLDGGGIAVAGRSDADPAEATANDEAVVVVYGPSGEENLAFGGGDGVFTIGASAAAPSFEDRFNDLDALKDGTIVAVGSTAVGDGVTDALIVRVGVAGELDRSFDHDGIVTFRPGALGGHASHAVIENAAGAIVVAGQARVGAAQHAGFVARYTAGGALDKTLSTDGLLTFGAEAGASTRLVDLAYAPNGSLVASGTTVPAGAPTGEDAYLARVVDDRADLRVRQFTINRSAVGPGATRSFTWLIRATGDRAPNAVLEVTVPKGTEIVDMTTRRGRCQIEPEVVCQLGNLKPGSRVTAAGVFSRPRDGRAPIKVVARSDVADPNDKNNTAISTLAVDSRNPVMSNARLSPRVFADKTTISFTMSEAGTVKLTFECGPLVGHRRSRGSLVCVPGRRESERIPCRAYTNVKGSETVPVKKGRNRITFDGKIGRTALEAGPYRMRLTPKDLANNLGVQRKLLFRLRG